MTPGTVIDRYLVERELGRGGMAVVYQVRHTTLDSVHALKLLHTDRPAVADRLLQEGKLQASLRHPNVVAVTDVILVEGSPGLVIEFLPDGALDEFPASTLSEDEIRELFRGILSGVAHAHALGMVHRDLKPGNVLLQRVDGALVPKVADFGLAKALVGGDDGPGLTRTGVAMGTPAYMAPEQVRDAKNVDARADVWALGVILFELIAGRRLFLGESSLDVMNAVVRGPSSAELERAPTWAVPALRAALSPVDRRPADAGVLLAILDGKATARQADETVDFGADHAPAPEAATLDFGVATEPAPKPAAETPTPAPPLASVSAEPPPLTEPAAPTTAPRWRLAVLALPLLLAFTSALEPLDTVLHYPVVRAARGEVAATDVVVIGITDDSNLRGLRAQHPAVIDALVEAGATAIVFDIAFRASDPADAAFAEAVQRSRAAGVPVFAPRLIRAEQALPLETRALDEALVGGIVEVLTDRIYGTTRLARARRRSIEGRSTWNVSVLAAAAHINAPEPRIERGELVLGGLRNAESADLLRLHPTAPPPVLPYGTEVAGAANRVAFIGLTSGPRDLLRTPEGPRYGVAVLAGLTQTLLRQATLRAATPEQNTLAALIAGLGAALLGSRLERRLQPVALVIPVAVLAVSLALAAGGLLVALLPTILAGALGLWAVRERS